jgi:predicted ATPase
MVAATKGSPMPTETPQPITRLSLRQYKSIEKCDLELSRLTILAGRNGAGKSNIIDALSFVTDALRDTLEYAVRTRGGIAQVRRKSSSKPTYPGVGVEMRLGDGSIARYRFRIAAVRDPLFRVDHEECVVTSADGSRSERFLTRAGQVSEWSPSSAPPPVAGDRLFLVSAAGLPEFRPVYDVLTRMVFHNLNPEAMKLPQRPEPGTLLSRDGSNLASVVKQLSASAPAKLDRVLNYVRAIGVPLSKIEHKQSGSLETLQVLQERGDENRPASFDAVALSDGTIRALGILVSLVSVGPEGSAGPSLIGIEEPETALHPAAAGALMDALSEGSESTQLLVTCHSPDLLDHRSVTADMIRPVVLEAGRTRVGRLDPPKAALLRDHLSTAGELLRLDQLEPDPEDLRRQDEAVGSLFEGLT